MPKTQAILKNGDTHTHTHTKRKHQPRITRTPPKPLSK